LKKLSENQKNASLIHNDINDNSPKTLLKKIKEIQKSNGQKSYQNKDKIIHLLKDKKLLK